MPGSRYAAPLDGQVRLLAKVARMYHEQNVRQADIAAALHISQAKVSRLLKRAEDVGIVRITVTMPAGLHTDLEEALEQRFGLAEAVVVDIDRGADDGEADEDEIVAALGAGAAAYLEATLSGTDRIGVASWSRTLLAMSERMRPLPSRGATEVVQLLGGMGAAEAQRHSHRLLADLTRSLGAEAVHVSAPGVLPAAALRDSILATDAMQEVAEHWRGLTMAVVGIGSVEPSAVLADSGNAFSTDELADLEGEGAVGDICHRIFRVDGSAVHGPLDERIVAISEADLRAIPRRVGVAGGERKHAAIRGALAGGWVNALVTDTGTARRLLAEG